MKSPTVATLFRICDALDARAADIVRRVDAARKRKPGPWGLDRAQSSSRIPPRFTPSSRSIEPLILRDRAWWPSTTVTFAERAGLTLARQGTKLWAGVIPSPGITPYRQASAAEVERNRMLDAPRIGFGVARPEVAHADHLVWAGGTPGSAGSHKG
jgi:hypothetical protein